MMNVFEFEAACSPAQHSELLYRQHKYSADTIIQEAVNVMIMHIHTYLTCGGYI